MSRNLQKRAGTLRICSGTARGRKIAVPPGLSVRPPREAVRQAVFNIIGPSVEAARVLDLYAGCGSFGLEALSRGAASAHFVEGDRATAAVLSSNISAAGFSGSGAVTVGEALDFLRGIDRGGPSGAFDLVFADPPYSSSSGKELAVIVAGLNSRNLLKEGSGSIVLHVEARFAIPEILDQLPGEKTVRAYGRNLICVARVRGQGS